MKWQSLKKQYTENPVHAKFAIMDDWIINIKGFGRLRFDHALLGLLCGFRQTDQVRPEAGGVLIGKHLIRGGRMVIDNYTPPQQDDRQGRCLFYRSIAHEKIVHRIWKQSNRISTYVGLWHTHPEDYPPYSLIDKKDWSKALNKSVYDGKNLFFLIIGRTHICCWMGTKRVIRNSIEAVGDYKIKV